VSVVAAESGRRQRGSAFDTVRNDPLPWPPPPRRRGPDAVRLLTMVNQVQQKAMAMAGTGTARD